MSFGSVSLPTMVAKAHNASLWNTFTCTVREIPRSASTYNDHVITQVATGLFGVREETIQRVKIGNSSTHRVQKPVLAGIFWVKKIRKALPGCVKR